MALLHEWVCPDISYHNIMLSDVMNVKYVLYTYTTVRGKYL